MAVGCFKSFRYNEARVWNLEGKYMSYIVIGASGGLGKRIATRLAARGSRLFLCGRTQDHLNETADAIRSIHPDAILQVETLDLSRDTSVDLFVSKLQSFDEPIRALVNTAAGFYKGHFADQPLDSIDEVLKTTYLGPVHLIARLIKLLPHEVPLDVINITSVAAATNLDASRSSSLHVATKAALQTFGLVLGRELCASGIRISGIAPGTFARKQRAGISEEAVVDCVEFLIDLPASTWIESIVLRPALLD